MDRKCFILRLKEICGWSAELKWWEESATWERKRQKGPRMAGRGGVAFPLRGECNNKVAMARRRDAGGDGSIPENWVCARGKEYDKNYKQFSTHGIKLTQGRRGNGLPWQRTLEQKSVRESTHNFLVVIVAGEELRGCGEWPFYTEWPLI